MSVNDEVLYTVEGGLAVITLNRPKALNALNLDMVLAIDARLSAYADDPAIEAVLIKGTGERAFCAGGDIRKIYDAGRSGESYPYDFFANEYRLNARIFHYPKPYIALMDGIVMGGGVGLSVHGRHRVVTERVMFAMPETGIGLFPDVGGSYFLSRLPGHIGMFLSLTGARLNAADAVYLGIGDVFVASDKLEALEQALSSSDLSADNDAVERVLANHADNAGESSIDMHREAIDRCFAGETVEAIIEAFRAEGSEWADRQLDILAMKSPTSLKITHRQVSLGINLDFNACMQMEYRMANGCARGHDFYEGVRALQVDKDNAPSWSPATLEEVSEADIAPYFEAEPYGGDLQL